MVHPRQLHSNRRPNLQTDVRILFIVKMVMKAHWKRTGLMYMMSMIMIMTCVSMSIFALSSSFCKIYNCTISLHKKCRGPQSLKLYFLKNPSGLQTPKVATTKNHKILTSKAGIKRPWLKYVAIANILPS